MGDEGKKVRKPKPQLLAFIMCDDVIRDERTKKVSLINTFTIINTKQFPCVHTHMVLHIMLTGGHGTHNCEIKLLRADDATSSEPIISLAGPVVFPDPLGVVSLNFSMHRIPFQSQGIYIFEISLDGNSIGSRRLSVKLTGGNE